MDAWISKKDLLKETGISYGQLYRWKRENLIPDAWFEKRSSFTGQETLFPRTLILERVHFILTHKDEYSLTELKNLLSPESDSRSYSLDAIKTLPGAERTALIYEAMHSYRPLNHGQALTIAICAGYDAACHPSDQALISFIETLENWQSEYDVLSESEGKIFVMKAENIHIPLFFSSSGEVRLPKYALIEFSLSMSEVSRTYTRMLNKIYEVK